MMERRNPMVHKTGRATVYPGIYPSHKSTAKEAAADSHITKGNQKNEYKRVEDIPMPNELEHPAAADNLPSQAELHKTRDINKGRENNRFSPLSFYLGKIQIDDIILIGLILLLLNEKKRDDILLVALIYILL